MNLSSPGWGRARWVLAVVAVVAVMASVAALVAGYSAHRSHRPTAGGASVAAASGSAATEPGFSATSSESASPSPSTQPSSSPSAAGKASPSATQRAGSDGGPVPASAVLVATENFDGTELDRGRWGTYDSVSTNKISRWDPAMVTVSGGELQIHGKGRSVDGRGNVSDGMCWCAGGAGSRTYGTWQVRARFDRGNGYGQALILWPDSDRWPDDGEIDFIETPWGDRGSGAGTVHWGTASDHRTDAGRLNLDFSAWHTYTVDWRAGRIRMYVDTTLLYDTAASRAGPVIPHASMHLAVQQEPGPFGDDWVAAPDATTPDDVVLHLDWVKIYS